MHAWENWFNFDTITITVYFFTVQIPLSVQKKLKWFKYLLPTKVRISERSIFFHKMDDRLLLSLAKMASLHSQLSTVQEDPSSSSSWFYYHVWHIHIQNKQKPWSINSIRKKVALSKCYIKLQTLISSLFDRTKTYIRKVSSVCKTSM